MTPATRIAVCISTFHRPEGLADVLASVRAQELSSPPPRITVVVVNNDPDDPRPEQICGDARRDCPHEIVCLAEGERGLSAPRNRALDYALDDHDYIAYIDDDSVAKPGWLAGLLAVQRQTNADVVTGPVIPNWEEPPPAWIERGGFFARHTRPTESRMRVAYTNNVLIRSEVLRETGVRFDLRFGLIGGDDVHFFRRLHDRGATIVWADDAVVEDLVLAERTTEAWIVRRTRREGMTTAIMERDLRPPVVAYPLVATKALLWTILGAGRLAFGVIGGQATRVRARCWLAWGRGLVEGLLGRTYREYLEER